MENFEDLLKKASEMSNDDSGDSYFGRQTYNPMWGKLSIQEDKWIIIYNPFDKMRVDKKLMRMDEFATSIFLMLKNKYSKNPKSIEIDMEDALKTISLVNTKCNAKEVLKEIAEVFKNKQLQIKIKKGNLKLSKTLEETVFLLKENFEGPCAQKLAYFCLKPCS
jgi:hypothetical protein